MDKTIEREINTINDYFESQSSIKLLYYPFLDFSGNHLLIFYSKLIINLFNKIYRNNEKIKNIFLDFNKNNKGNNQFELKIYKQNDVDESLKSKKIFDLGLILFYLKYKNDLYKKISKEIIENQIIDEIINEKLTEIIREQIIKNEAIKNKIMNNYKIKNIQRNNNEITGNEIIYETDKMFDINERIISYIKTRKLLDEDMSNFLISLIDPKDRPTLEEISINKIINDNNENFREKKFQFPNNKQKFIMELQKSNFLKNKETKNIKRKFNFKKKLK